MVEKHSEFLPWWGENISYTTTRSLVARKASVKNCDFPILQKQKCRLMLSWYEGVEEYSLCKIVWKTESQRNFLWFLERSLLNQSGRVFLNPGRKRTIVVM